MILHAWTALTVMNRSGSWFTNLEQTPQNRCQQLPALYKQLIDYDNWQDRQIDKQTNFASNKPMDT